MTLDGSVLLAGPALAQTPTNQAKHQSLATLGQYVRVHDVWTDNGAAQLGLSGVHLVAAEKPTADQVVNGYLPTMNGMPAQNHRLGPISSSRTDSWCGSGLR
ncbi:MAG: hypothetical protein K0U64_02570 [Actinomycetia bacterium]|nr:hypothetical protein [Actinomycetes bacterium]